MKNVSKLLVVFSFFGISSMALYAAGEVKLNTNLVVEADGTVRSDGAATVWNDLNVFPDATTKSGSNPPVMTKFKDNGSASQGVFLNAFSASIEQELYFTIQLPHGYKEGTAMYPHVHWTPMATTGSASYVVVWGFEYTIMKHTGTFGNTTIVTGSAPVNLASTPTGIGFHTITAFSPIAASAENKISTIMVCRLFRKAADAADVYDGLAGLLGFDIHYESDMAGSRTDLEK